jgi:hypothetical protein
VPVRIAARPDYNHRAVWLASLRVDPSVLYGQLTDDHSKDKAMAEIDAKLLAALKLARRMPMNFAFVAKGPNQGKLLVSKKRLTASEVAAARKAAGGGKVFRGRCFGEDNKLIFELPKEPPTTLHKQLRNIITHAAGLILRVEARLAAELVAEDDDDEAVPPTQPAPSAGPKTSGNIELKAAVSKRLAALVDGYRNAIAQKGPEAAHLGELFASFKRLVAAQDYAQAAKVLDELERLVRVLA